MKENPYKRFVNTHLFSEAANHKKKHGYYCGAPFKTKEYREYWDEQIKRCREGYSVGGVRVTGYHYFHLNFVNFEIVADPKNHTKGKITSFPRFWDIHYDFFHFKEEAYKAGKHVVILKPRGSGFSEIMASIGVCDYAVTRNSKNFYFAYDKGYLQKDGIISKCWDRLNYCNTETEGAMRHLRQIKNSELHKRASYYNSKGDEEGYQSEIIGRVIDHPRKVRGARTGTRGHVFFEEGGSFPDVEPAIAAARPLVEQGGLAVAQILLWGTGGEIGAGIDGLETIFYNPDAYNFYAIKNVWDEDRAGSECGFFFPAYAFGDKFTDEDGNCNEAEAKKHHDGMRARSRKLSRAAEDKYVAENPYSPSEAFLRFNQNEFPVRDIQAQRMRVESDPGIVGMIKYGWIAKHPTTGDTFFKLDPDASPIDEFPHKAGTDLESKSLGAVYVYKHRNNITPTEDNIIVAWYTARPRRMEDFYKNLFLLAEHYNAKIQSEIAGGGKGIIDYAKNHKLLHYCEKEPQIMFKNDLEKKNLNYFMEMNQDRKQLGLAYLIDWIQEQRAISVQGDESKTVYTLNKIYDPMLLLEMERFSDEGNYDRVSALIILMFMVKEKISNPVKKEIKTSEFFNRPLFTDAPMHHENILPISEMRE
jgi:hypothetical protein